MRTTSHGGELRSGMSAAVKAAAVVLAVGMLAVVAGKAGYTPESAIAAFPGHAIAAAPAGVPAQELQYPMPPRSMAAPAPDEPPVATF
jgi:hypothetical protein